MLAAEDAMDNFTNFKTVACSIAPWAEADSVCDHDPKWHEFGVLGHTKKVFNNAIEIKSLTGIDIVKAALWHDIGKFIVRYEKPDKLGEYSFKGHEKESEKYLREKCPDNFTKDDLFLVANHGLIRGDSAAVDIVDKCNDVQLLRKLILICAADISGKGFTKAQKEQRERLAAKFEELANLAGLDAILVKDIILKW